VRFADASIGSTLALRRLGVGCFGHIHGNLLQVERPTEVERELIHQDVSTKSLLKKSSFSPVR